MDWITCTDCEEEFRIINDSETKVQYCPFCASELELEETEDDWDQGDSVEF
jgi:DNA-directed RNA polymerase subunit RPC12/RpoP